METRDPDALLCYCCDQLLTKIQLQEEKLGILRAEVIGKVSALQKVYDKRALQLADVELPPSKVPRTSTPTRQQLPTNYTALQHQQTPPQALATQLAPDKSLINYTCTTTLLVE